MYHRIKIQPAVEPVTLAEIRAHLGISQPGDTARDGVIDGRIVTARTMAEHITQLALITQTWIGYSQCFSNVMPLKGPLQSVASIKYIDQNGALQTLAAALYDVDTVAAVVVPAYGVCWPTPRDVRNAVQIEYVCGYGLAEAVPEPIKAAIRFTVARWESYQSTLEGSVGYPPTLPNAALQLLEPYRDYRGMF